MFPTDLSIGPVQLAREARARGLDSIWFPDTPHPGQPPHAGAGR